MAAQLRPIRVGIIRCDTHGFWYAPFFEHPNPRLYRKNHWGTHYYFYRWDNPDLPKFRAVPGMRVTRLFDPDNPARAAALAEAYEGRPRICRTLDEVSDDVDLVYLADCTGEGDDHLKLASPGLKKGVPHFIDKPFAFTLADARALVALARKHKTALMSTSILRQSPFMARFRTQLRDVAPVGCIVIPGNGPKLAGFFHLVSIAQAVLGEGCEWVECMGPHEHGLVRLHYPGGKDGVDVIIQNTFGNTAGYVRDNSVEYNHTGTYVYAYGDASVARSQRIDDFRFMYSGEKIVRMAKRMAATKQPPISYSSILELMEMIEASRLARKRAKRVYLRELREGAAKEATL